MNATTHQTIEHDCNDVTYERNAVSTAGTVNIFGIPVDNLTLETAIVRILKLVDEYQQDRRAKYVATVNVDFLMNSLGWTASSVNRHPELMDILRNAELVTADGMPIVWLSRLLNAPLAERVTGADLVPALCEHIARTGHSIYFLGGRGDVGQQAADLLQKQYPGLNVVGCSSPFVHTEGEAMLNTREQDQQILDEINTVKPDILLIGFGNPKQELWFNRNKTQLDAAVSIGIGGTYEFITGSVKRAPKWIQKSGFEWVYRIFQDPKRLWKRYAYGIPKLAVLSAPVIATNLVQFIRNRTLLNDKKRYLNNIKPSWGNREVKILMTQRLDNESMQTFMTYWEPKLRDYQKVVIDYVDVEFIDSSALGI